MGGANGLIVAFVVAVWAAYFVPLVLRRYDEASTSSSLETLSPLSRVIHRRDVETAEPEPTSTGPVESTSPADQGSPAEPVEARRPTRQAAIVAARRRRRTLLTLLTALLLVSGLAAFSVVSPVWVAAPAALVVVWLVACRVQVRGERGLSRPRLPRVTVPTMTVPQVSLPTVKRPRVSRRGWLRMPSRPVRPASEGIDEKASSRRTVDLADEDTVVVSGQLEDVDPQRRHAMQDAPLEADALDDKLVIAVPSVSTTGEPLWDPLPVTLPTYVTKPRAGRTVRTIDFDKPGAWTSGHVEGEDVELPGRSAAEQPAQDYAQRRAAGE